MNIQITEKALHSHVDIKSFGIMQKVSTFGNRLHENKFNINQLFSVRTQLEKTRDHKIQTNHFIDFQKAYDSINRDEVYS